MYDTRKLLKLPAPSRSALLLRTSTLQQCRFGIWAARGRFCIELVRCLVRLIGNMTYCRRSHNEFTKTRSYQLSPWRPASGITLTYYTFELIWLLNGNLHFFISHTRNCWNSYELTHFVINLCWPRPKLLKLSIYNMNCRSVAVIHCMSFKFFVSILFKIKSYWIVLFFIF